MLAALNFLLRGLPFIYQGQELGMENQTFSDISDVDDINTLDEYKVALNAGLSEAEALKAVSRFSRDNARTPMQWSDEPNAGFTTGKPWLRINENYKAINAKAQMEDAQSVRSFYKALIALRKSPEYKETIVYGTLEPVWEDVHNLMAYYRKGDRTVLVVGNYQRELQTIELPAPYRKLLLNNYQDVEEDGTRICLKGYQVLVLEMEA
jgi:oligo-1,6-glucosidase